MAIMAALSLIAVPWFVKIAQRQQLKSAAFEIQTTLLAARMKAVKLNQPVTVVINSTASAGPAARRSSLRLRRRRRRGLRRLMTLPAKAAILAATPKVAGGVITFSGDGRVNMAPTPAPTPGNWFYVLQGPVGAPTPNQITIQAWPNGRVAIVTPTNWY